MDTETLTVHQKGEDFEITVQHDQSGSAYGIPLSKNAYEQLRQHFVSGCRSFQIGQTVYHRNVYKHKEPLKIVGILEDKLLLEGDFSGGTHNVIQRDWLPIKGTSRIYNHAFKSKARKDAIAIETLTTPCAGSQDNTYKCMMDMVHAVMVLTNDVSLNPECE